MISSKSPSRISLDAVERQADAVIRHPPLGEVVGADALAAVAGAHLQAAAVGVFAVVPARASARTAALRSTRMAFSRF